MQSYDVLEQETTKSLFFASVICGGYMISATDKAHLAITVAETAETTYLFLIKERNDEIAHGDTDNGRDEARQLEGVVDHIFANTGGACAVKADGCHLCGIVRQEEIAVQRGKHHQ